MLWFYFNSDLCEPVFLKLSKYNLTFRTLSWNKSAPGQLMPAIAPREPFSFKPIRQSNLHHLTQDGESFITCLCQHAFYFVLVVCFNFLHIIRISRQIFDEFEFENLLRLPSLFFSSGVKLSGPLQKHWRGTVVGSAVMLSALLKYHSASRN